MIKARKLEIIGAGFDTDTVQDYFALVVTPKMQWEPVGIVLHNTETLTRQWPGVDANGRKISIAHRLADMNYAYANIKGWSSGPHCFVAPDRIWIFSPPWHPGTGSPSWDKDHFHVVLIGDYAKEIMPKSVQENAVAVMAAMYDIIGKEPSVKNLRYHRDDPKTRHKRCPGANAGPKDKWVKDIAAWQRSHPSV